ncbi:hypothetical protein BX600DRAFT_480877 [Xylariales sp. PMI_506]|nr:hypothetical protein BX600DRAFT_480877 [Xylariales sp. PMI_506]
METVDLLIVGAGWHGLAMAKTYLEATETHSSTTRDFCSPTKDVLIVDYAESIGGTWAHERLYPGLKTNNIVGSYEFSDFPMDLKRYALKPKQHIPGATVHRYLLDFVDYYGLKSRVRLRTKVETASLLADGTWLVDFSTEYGRKGFEDTYVGALDTRSTTSQKSGQLVAKRLVLATGLTSEPYMPYFPGQERFQGKIFHSKELKSKSEEIQSAQSVVVVGGNKSAWDTSYNAAESGAQVHMVMRPAGGGPSWLWRPVRLFSFVNTSLSRLSLTRLFTWFDPFPFGSSGRAARWFLHHTTLGRWLCSLFWAFLDRYLCYINGYDDDTSNMKMMRPWTSTFWMGNSLGIHNYETNWFQHVVNGRITPHIADIQSLDGNTVLLSNGTRVSADVLVACTGWKSIPSIIFYPEWEPIISPDLLVGEAFMKARLEVYRLCPDLRLKPVRKLHGKELIHRESKSEVHPFRLYRFMVPPSRVFLEQRNIAFIGGHLSIHALMLAQAQALWIASFFLGHLPSIGADVEKIAFETILHTEYERIRRPGEAGGAGARFPDLVFDSLPYMDLLFDDLGLRTQRKPSWVKHVLEPHTLADYRGLVKEWASML